MLVSHCLRRSIPILTLAAAIVLAGGHLKSFLADISTSRGADLEPRKVRAESSAVESATPGSADVSNRAEESRRHRGAAGAVDDWVRTRTGWEREAKWIASSGYEPALHPVVVAALVSLVALWALVAFPVDAVESVDDPQTVDTTFTSDS